MSTCKTDDVFRVAKLTRLEAWLTSAWLVGAQYKHRLIYRC